MWDNSRLTESVPGLPVPMTRIAARPADPPPFDLPPEHYKFIISLETFPS